jgi:hypothetical protein
MKSPLREPSDQPGKIAERGQGIVEFALILPIILLLMVSVAELGVVFGNTQSLIYGSREGARVGSALALGEDDLCTPTERDPSGVDGLLVGAVQRILRSPDAGIKMNKVEQIRIFRADPFTGAETADLNIWDRSGVTDIDPGPGTEFIDFAPVLVNWPACDRINSGTNPDSIGVTVVYTYEFVMPIASVVNAVSGGRAQMTLQESTVMALNPTL